MLPSSIKVNLCFLQNNLTLQFYAHWRNDTRHNDIQRKNTQHNIKNPQSAWLYKSSSVIMLNVVIVQFFLVSVVMPNVVMPNVVMPNVVMVCVVAPF